MYWRDLEHILYIETQINRINVRFDSIIHFVNNDGPLYPYIHRWNPSYSVLFREGVRIDTRPPFPEFRDFGCIWSRSSIVSANILILTRNKHTYIMMSFNKQEKISPFYRINYETISILAEIGLYKYITKDNSSGLLWQEWRGSESGWIRRNCPHSAAFTKGFISRFNEFKNLRLYRAAVLHFYYRGFTYLYAFYPTR